LRIRTYTNIWRIEGILYKIYDVELPVPVTYTQIGYLVLSFLFLIIFSDIFPFSLIKNDLFKYVVFPVGFTWFMSKKTFDGKKPYKFFIAFIKYCFRNKITNKSRDIKLKNFVLNCEIGILKNIGGFENEVSS